MKTETSCMLPVLGCLDAAQRFVRAKVSSPSGWNAVNSMQKEFLAFYGPSCVSQSLSSTGCGGHSG